MNRVNLPILITLLSFMSFTIAGKNSLLIKLQDAADDKDMMDKLANQINTELKQLEAKMPKDVQKYISKLDSSNQLIKRVFNLADTEKVLKDQLKLPKEIQDKFKAIIFAKVVAFKTFNMIINKSQAVLDQMIGGAGKVDQKVELIYLRLGSKATLIPAYTMVNEKKCKRILFIKKCKDHWVKKNRGYNANEIQIIAQGLKAEAFRKMSESIKAQAYNFGRTWFEAGLTSLLTQRGKEVTEVEKKAFDASVKSIYGKYLTPLETQLKAIVDRNNNYISVFVRGSIEKYQSRVKSILSFYFDKFKEIKAQKTYTFELLFTFGKDKVDSLSKDLATDFAKSVNLKENSKHAFDCSDHKIEKTILKEFVEEFNDHDHDSFRDACVSANKFDINKFKSTLLPDPRSFYLTNSCLIRKSMVLTDQSKSFFNKRAFDDLLDYADDLKCLSIALKRNDWVEFYFNQIVAIQKESLNYKASLK